MTLKYSQRSLLVLSLLGILSAIMSVLSVILIFQLHSQQTAVKESPASSSSSSVIPAHVWAVLLPVSTVLSALSLSLHLSSVVVCLLHSYFSTEVCRGEQDTERYVSCMQSCSSSTCWEKTPGTVALPASSLTNVILTNSSAQFWSGWITLKGLNVPLVAEQRIV